MPVSTRKDQALQLISETMPVGSPEPTDPETIAKLVELTNELIDASGGDSLRTDPFAEVYDRHVPIDHAQIGQILCDKVVLVTGGHGFVGSNLVAKLQQFGVRKIVVVDLVTTPGVVKVDTQDSDRSIPVVAYECDVRDVHWDSKTDRLSLAQVFAKERPQVVFHLAAQRLPGLAETEVHRTVSTNLQGCQNIIDLCEFYQVEICIFSSTGKASRYFTPDVYAGTKKIAEWLFSDYSRPKQCQYGIVRFTHVVENSPISAELDRRVADGMVSLHAPDRYIYAQNIEESVSLLLKTLTIVELGKTNMLAVRDLSWPINTLEVALHKILVAGANIPLYFKGLPLGYERHVFMGQLDLSGQQEVLPMLNVLETYRSKVCAASNTVTFTISPFDSAVLERAVEQIKYSADDEDIRQTVANTTKAVALSSLVRADRRCLQDILRWGTSEQELAASGVDISYHKDTIDLLTQAINAHHEAQKVVSISQVRTLPERVARSMVRVANPEPAWN
jgi:hypothetical protein